MFTYYTEGVCSKQIDLNIKDSKIVSVKFHGGCSGNLSGISKIIEGMDVLNVIKAFENNPCGPRSTSCPDQLAKALKAYMNQIEENS